MTQHASFFQISFVGLGELREQGQAYLAADMTEPRKEKRVSNPKKMMLSGTSGCRIRILLSENSSFAPTCIACESICART